MTEGVIVKKLVNNVIVLVFLGVSIFVAYSSIRDWNRLEVVYQFHDDGRVYGLYPLDRVSKEYETQDTRHKTMKFQEMTASPVYIDIRYWQPFKHAQVEIEYKKDPDVDVQIGYKVGKEFQWKLFSIHPSLSSRAVLDIDLNGEYVPYGNVHRWIVSSSNVQELKKVIRIYEIKFTFTR